MKKPHFLLVMPDYSDFPLLFIDNLEKTGFISSLITDKVSKFRYKGLESIKNLFIKNIFRNKEYKQNLIDNHFLQELNNNLYEIENDLDYILVIRPDNFPIPFIKKLKKEPKNLLLINGTELISFRKLKIIFSFLILFLL